jgi:hypothetical protein
MMLYTAMIVTTTRHTVSSKMQSTWAERLHGRSRLSRRDCKERTSVCLTADQSIGDDV